MQALSILEPSVKAKHSHGIKEQYQYFPLRQDEVFNCNYNFFSTVIVNILGRKIFVATSVSKLTDYSFLLFLFYKFEGEVQLQKKKKKLHLINTTKKRKSPG